MSCHILDVLHFIILIMTLPELAAPLITKSYCEGNCRT